MTAGTGEDDIISRFFRPIATSPAARGLFDDAALLTPPPGCDLVLTKDALVAGVHFFPDDSPASVARKALRVNLSDLAAKGAQPLGALLALALPRPLDEAWLEAFALALGADADLFGCPILGGDTVSTPGPISLSITAFGAVPSGGFVPRTGAAPGQAILVSGTIGDAALGLQLRLDPGRAGFRDLPEAGRAHLADRYLHPQPRLALADALRAHAACAMDVSDGLVGDVTKMLAASGCGGLLRASQVPLSEAARVAIEVEPELLATALGGGDDYEIAATVPLDAVPMFRAAAAAAGVPVSVIGETYRGEGLDVVGRDGHPLQLAHGSFSHF
ncbi:thiamine-monophosphate kinase [Azorhizobium oxalatiphilum]|uniref:Thiamine-monophosphate kinase n=1 Tax=Azorhizobium oxalatiphilum TaxID=980631 RepID=A0A917C9R2_9HYPH|nr:thiamine-phosphate kinase [Azorhizobium oxalatiphilum]GGF74476.1 thiamine-monophosphate kinase [Azorhizobium oxalatiphilum]